MPIDPVQQGQEILKLLDPGNISFIPGEVEHTIIPGEVAWQDSNTMDQVKQGTGTVDLPEWMENTLVRITTWHDAPLLLTWLC